MTMSINFSIENDRTTVPCEYCKSGKETFEGRCPLCDDTGEMDYYLNFANMNAMDILIHIGIDPVSYGSCPAKEFAIRCRRSLIGVAGKLDPATEEVETVGKHGCAVITVGRREGYLHERVRELLRLAEGAPEGANVVWN